MSTQQEPAVPGPGTKEATVAEKKVYRLPGPQVLWWVWVVFVAGNLLDLAIQGHDYESLQIAVGLLAITGLVYACTLRPRVIADAGGLTMINPLRDYRIPWPRIAEIYMAESVQFKCSEGDGAQRQDAAQLGAVLAAQGPAEGRYPRPPLGARRGQPPGRLRPDA